MARHKKSSRSRKSKRAAALAVPSTSAGDAILIGQSKLRRQLNVSPMTFWRWLRDEELAFPTALRIRDRVYFSKAEVDAWLARQQQAA